MGVIAEIFDEGGAKLFGLPVRLEGRVIRGRCDLGMARGIAVSWRVGADVEGLFDDPVRLTPYGAFTFELSTGDERLARSIFAILEDRARAAADLEPPRTGYKYGGLL